MDGTNTPAIKAASNEKATLTVPAVSALRGDMAASDPSKGLMERSTSEDIREEREDLKEAAEYTKSVVVELSPDGIIRWVSPSWLDVVGTAPYVILGKPIASILVSEQNVFEKATETMRKDDARSQNIRFTVMVGPASTMNKKYRKSISGLPQEGESPTTKEKSSLDLEGQGIMVYDRSTGKESHVSISGFCWNRANPSRPCG
jgi:serine/threonine-protein kinase RIM15